MTIGAYWLDDFFYLKQKTTTNTTQKMKFSIKKFFSKYDQICRKLRIWSHLLKKSVSDKQ